MDDNHLQHWKYIDRWKEGGIWRYLYPGDKKEGSSGSSRPFGQRKIARPSSSDRPHSRREYTSYGNAHGTYKIERVDAKPSGDSSPKKPSRPFARKESGHPRAKVSSDSLSNERRLPSRKERAWARIEALKSKTVSFIKNASEFPEVTYNKARNAVRGIIAKKKYVRDFVNKPNKVTRYYSKERDRGRANAALARRTAWNKEAQ